MRYKTGLVGSAPERPGPARDDQRKIASSKRQVTR